MTKSKKLALRVGVFASAFLLVTAAGLGATMAKYAKTSDTSATSHVAQFGVSLDWTSDSTFATSYIKDDSSATSITNSVQSVVTAENKVIAPGTSGSMTLEVKGTAEVAFTLNISLNENYSNDWKTSNDGVTYHPVSISAVKQTYGTSDWNSAEDVTLTNNEVAEIVFNPGTVTRTLYTFTWTWAFDNRDVTAGYTVNSDIYKATTAFNYYKVTTGFTNSSTTYAANDFITAATYESLETTNQNNCTKVEVAANDLITSADYTKLTALSLASDVTVLHAATSEITTTDYNSLTTDTKASCTAITGNTADTYMSTVSTATYALGGTVTATQID